MLTPAAKRRRRAEAATATLKRPFRSPMVRTAQSKQHPGSSQSAAENRDSTPASEEQRADIFHPTPTLDVRKRKRPVSLTAPGTPKATLPVFTSLEDLVEHFSQDLDAGDRTLQQNRMHAPASLQDNAIPTSENTAEDPPDSQSTAGGTDKELRILISRWRDAGRMAADEVFGIVSERVERAGGVQAWRKMMQSSADYGNETKQRQRRRSEEGSSDGDGGEEDEEEEAEEADGNKEFTMTMMLASLGVDPDVLGYDETEDRWKD